MQTQKRGREKRWGATFLVLILVTGGGVGEMRSRWAGWHQEVVVVVSSVGKQKKIHSNHHQLVSPSCRMQKIMFPPLSSVCCGHDRFTSFSDGGGKKKESECFTGHFMSPRPARDRRPWSTTSNGGRQISFTSVAIRYNLQVTTNRLYHQKCVHT